MAVFVVRKGADVLFFPKMISKLPYLPIRITTRNSITVFMPAKCYPVVKSLSQCFL